MYRAWTKIVGATWYQKSKYQNWSDIGHLSDQTQICTHHCWKKTLTFIIPCSGYCVVEKYWQAEVLWGKYWQSKVLETIGWFLINLTRNLSIFSAIKKLHYTAFKNCYLCCCILFSVTTIHRKLGRSVRISVLVQQTQDRAEGTGRTRTGLSSADLGHTLLLCWPCVSLHCELCSPHCVSMWSASPSHFIVHQCGWAAHAEFTVDDWPGHSCARPVCSRVVTYCCTGKASIRGCVFYSNDVCLMYRHCYISMSPSILSCGIVMIPWLHSGISG